MVEDNLPFGLRTAENYMRIARHPVLSNPHHGSDLPASWRTLAELARLDPEALEQAIADGRVTPETGRSEALALVYEQPGLEVEVHVVPADCDADADQDDDQPGTKGNQFRALLEDSASARDAPTVRTVKTPEPPASQPKTMRAVAGPDLPERVKQWLVAGIDLVEHPADGLVILESRDAAERLWAGLGRLLHPVRPMGTVRNRRTTSPP
jgi:hypothetical protein